MISIVLFSIFEYDDRFQKISAIHERIGEHEDSYVHRLVLFETSIIKLTFLTVTRLIPNKHSENLVLIKNSKICGEHRG